MAETRTGLDPWLSQTGTSYIQELVRQASRIASEMVEPATNGIPRTVIISRDTITQAASSALGVNATTTTSTATVQATYFQKTTWGQEMPAVAADIRVAKRALLVADVPELGGKPADKIYLTDVITVDDPEFGDIDLKITKVTPLRGAGLIHVEAEYQRS